MMLRRFLLGLLALVSIISLLGCSAKIPPPAGKPVEEPAKEAYTKPTFVALQAAKAERMAAELSMGPQELGSWSAMRPALEKSLRYIKARPEHAVCVSKPGLTLTWGQLRDSVAELIALLSEIDRDPSILAERFQWLKLEPGTLLTGYYEPWLEASLTPDEEYPFPLYGVPDDLKKLDLGQFHTRWKGQTLIYQMGDDGIEPYHDREAIDRYRVLKGEGHEIAWAKNPVDVFFLQIQGSGRLALPDGSSKHILYGGKNGHRYVSLGKLLINRGHVPKDEMSMQRIRRFLSNNRDIAWELMFENPSYVFFTLSDEGPYGSIGSILTPKVSVAVDRKTIPLGSVLALRTALVNYDLGESEEFFSLVLAQDTGGAIKGTRMDLFCGSGEEAELLAGHLQEESEVFMLVSRRALKFEKWEDAEER